MASQWWSHVLQSPFTAVQNWVSLKVQVSFGLRCCAFRMENCTCGSEASRSNTVIIKMSLVVTVSIMVKQMSSYLLLSKLNTFAWPPKKDNSSIWNADLIFCYSIKFLCFSDRLQLLLNFLTVALWGGRGMLTILLPEAVFCICKNQPRKISHGAALLYLLCHIPCKYSPFIKMSILPSIHSLSLPWPREVRKSTWTTSFLFENDSSEQNMGTYTYMLTP